MSEEDEEFQKRWGLRKNDSDGDSSSDDQSRRPDSDIEPKRNKRKIATGLFPDKDDQKTLNSPQSHPEGENHSSDEEPEKVPIKSRKTERRKARTKKPDRKAFDRDPFYDCASIDLSGHMESLVESVKASREGLLKWMNDELDESFKDTDKTSQPAAVAKKRQRRGSIEPQNTTPKRSKNPRSNPTKPRRKPGTITQNPEEGSSDKLAKDSKTSHETSEVVIPSNKPAENGVSGTTPVENNPNQNQKQKGKRLGSSSKKQKVVESDQQTDKAPETVTATAGSASASNYLTLPTVLPRQEPEHSERTNSEGENVERSTRSRNALMNQSMSFTPRSQQNEGIFSQNSLRNVSDYEQNTTSTNGNIWGAGSGNGSGFTFGIHPQGLNSGIGMPTFSSNFGLQYLTHQESFLSGLRVNNSGHPILPSGNHSFGESISAYNQHQLRFKAQGGLLHSSDNTRAGNLQSR